MGLHPLDRQTSTQPSTCTESSSFDVVFGGMHNVMLTCTALLDTGPFDTLAALPKFRAPELAVSAVGLRVSCRNLGVRVVCGVCHHAGCK